MYNEKTARMLPYELKKGEAIVLKDMNFPTGIDDII